MLTKIDIDRSASVLIQLHGEDAAPRNRPASSMSASGVRRGKAALSSGCKPHPATIAPAGSNRSSHGGNEMAETSRVEGHELVSLDFRFGSEDETATR